MKLALCAILALSTVAQAWDSRPYRDENRDGWRLVAADQSNDHGFLAARAIQNLAGRASYTEANTYADAIEFGAWFEDQIGEPDQGVALSPLDYMTVRIYQTNHFTMPSMPTWVLRALYWHLTQDPIMTSRGIFGSRSITMLGPNAYTFVVSGALVRARILYQTALAAMRAGDLRTAWWLVGRADHYVEDLTQPMHDASASIFDAQMRVYNGLFCFHLGWDPFTTANCHWVIERDIALRTMSPAPAGFLLLTPANAGLEAAQRSLWRGAATWGEVLNRAAAWHNLCSSRARWPQAYASAENDLWPWAIQDGASMFDAFWRAENP